LEVYLFLLSIKSNLLKKSLIEEVQCLVEETKGKPEKVRESVEQRGECKGTADERTKKKSKAEEDKSTFLKLFF